MCVWWGRGRGEEGGDERNKRQQPHFNTSLRVTVPVEKEGYKSEGVVEI